MAETVYHVPIMKRAVIEDLRIDPEGIYLDATCGGGGHSLAIAEQLRGGHLYAMDQDPDAIAEAGKRLAGYPVTMVHANFVTLKNVLESHGTKADGILMDLGVSSHELDEGSRGFSYHKDAPLDMRMSQEGETAADLVNRLSEAELASVIFRYGEEKYARSIAANIVKARAVKPIETTLELADLITESVPAKARRDKHPARKTFQALRILTNRELDVLESAMCDAFEMLKPGGRLVILTFHSLEDRMVKQQFAKWCTGCTCPPEFPVCICGHKPEGMLPHKKPIVADAEELAINPRSRSAKLRCIEKL